MGAILMQPLLSWKLFAVVFVLAGLLRSWGAFEYNGYVGDEGIHVPAAISLTKYGTTSDWFHPQLSSLILAGTMKLFGDNSVGWRIGGIAFGTASILLLYLIARQLYPDSSVPILAASLLAFDPFDIHFCRTVMMESPAILFFLLFLYFMLEYRDNNRSLIFAGIAMGLAIATKDYFVFAIPVVVVYAFSRASQRSGENKSLLLVQFTITLVLLPIAIDLISYGYWFGRGYTLSEFIQFKSDAYLTLQNFQYAKDQLVALGGKPWEWFIRPLAFGYQIFSDGASARFVIEINNPLFRVMVIPAMCIVVVHAVKKRSFHWLLAPLLFMACYVLFFAVKRRIGSYSALVLLPFAYLALAQAVIILASKYNREKEATIALLIAALIQECYLFPLTEGFLVSTAFYEPILSMTRIY